MKTILDTQSLDAKGIFRYLRTISALGVVALLSSCGGDNGPSSYALNAYVSGLTGSGLQVTLNGGSPISISGNSQTTIARLTNGATYTVTINAQPLSPSQICTASNPSGKIAGNNVDVMIGCVANNSQPANVTSTMVTVDAGIPNAAVSAIQKTITPDAAGTIGSSLQVSTTGSTGQGLVLALDANNNIMLGSVVTSSATNLSADSTALILVRLVIGDAITSQAGSAIDLTIRGNAGFISLVTAVQNALDGGTSPALNQIVLQNVASIASQVVPSISTASAVHESIRAIAQPTASLPLPITVVPDTLLNGQLTVQITSSGAHAVDLKNSMPIPWSASSVDSSGSSLDSDSLPGLGGQFGVTAGTVAVLSSTAGFTLTIEQNDKTHAQIGADLVTGVLKTTLGFTGLVGNTCSLSVINTSLETTLELQVAPNQSWDTYKDALSNFILTKAPPLIKACSTSETITTALEAAVSLLDGVALIQAIGTGAKTETEAAYAVAYWTQMFPIGVCEDSVGNVVNCAKSYAFSPSSLLMAPGATDIPTLTAQDNSGAPTGVPSGLNYDPLEGSAFTVNPNTGEIDAKTSATALDIGGPPVTVTVSDQETDAKGSLAVSVLYPIISPVTSTIPVGAGASSIVTLTLTDSTGNAVFVPPGVMWSSNDPNAATLKNMTALTDPGTTGKSSWSSPAGAVPGTVTIQASGPDGTPYGSATVNVVSSVPTMTVTANPTVLPANGGSVTITATLAPSDSSSPLPTGTVTFSDGSGILCSNVTVTSAVATCAATVAAAPDTVTATYSGDKIYSVSTGSTTITAGVLGWTGIWSGPQNIEPTGPTCSTANTLLTLQITYDAAGPWINVTGDTLNADLFDLPSNYTLNVAGNEALTLASINSYPILVLSGNTISYEFGDAALVGHPLVLCAPYPIILTRQ